MKALIPYIALIKSGWIAAQKLLRGIQPIYGLVRIKQEEGNKHKNPASVRAYQRITTLCLSSQENWGAERANLHCPLEWVVGAERSSWDISPVSTAHLHGSPSNVPRADTAEPRIWSNCKRKGCRGRKSCQMVSIADLWNAEQLDEE